MTYQSTLSEENRFSHWSAWKKRHCMENLSFPGVYILAISHSSLSEAEFSWIKEIVYIGMTNSINGLRGRLRQFENTIRGKQGHGGADRFCYDYQNPEDLFSCLYVAVSPFPCDVKVLSAQNLIIMGDVAKAEYECFARYAKNFGKLPKYNDKAMSPKQKKK